MAMRKTMTRTMTGTMTAAKGHAGGMSSSGLQLLTTALLLSLTFLASGASARHSFALSDPETARVATGLTKTRPGGRVSVRSMTTRFGAQQAVTSHGVLQASREESRGGPESTGASSVSTGCTVSFGGQDMVFQKCLSLDPSGSFNLGWTKLANPNSTTNSTVLRTYFSGTPEVAGTWAGWGVSSTGTMVGADVIVGYASPSDSTQSSVRPFHLSGISGSSFLLDQTTGHLKVVSGSARVEFSDSGSTVRILADVTGVAEGQAVTVLWSGGQSVEDYGQGLLGPHSTSRGLMRINFTSASASAAPTFVSYFDQTVVHSWLSTIGFGVLTPIGILVARHTKLWAGLGRVWFFTHILLQLAGYTLGVVGWAYGVWARAQPSADSLVYPQHAHAGIGIAVFCTATVQVLTPVLKPDKKAPARFYWNLVHWSLGYATAILSVAAVFLGFDVLQEKSVDYEAWELAYTVFISCCAALLLLLEPLTWYLHFKEKETVQGEAPKPQQEPSQETEPELGLAKAENNEA